MSSTKKILIFLWILSDLCSGSSPLSPPPCCPWLHFPHWWAYSYCEEWFCLLQIPSMLQESNYTNDKVRSWLTSPFIPVQTPYFWPSNYWDPENSDYGQYSYIFGGKWAVLWFYEIDIFVTFQLCTCASVQCRIKPDWSWQIMKQKI